MADSVKIIQNGYVITCDPYRTMGRSAVLIRNDRIAEFAKTDEGFRARFPGADIIDASDKILFPGFVDAHFHGESFLLRRWTRSVPYTKWSRDASVRRILSYVYREASKDELATMYRPAYFAALKSGITCLSEFGFDNLDLPLVAASEAMKRSDLRGVLGIHNGDQYDRARGLSSPALRFALTIAQEEELTLYNLQTAIRTAREVSWPLISHLGETRRNEEIVKRNFQRSTARVFDEFQVFRQPLHLAHLNAVDPDDVQILARSSASMIVCPVSLVEHEADRPPLKELHSAGIRFALGTNWGQPRPLTTMRAFVSLALSAGLDGLHPSDVLEMHTLQAARVLGLDRDIGSLEPGKKADITFVDVADFRYHTLVDPWQASKGLVSFFDDLAAAPVSDVMINGEFFVRRGQVMTYSEEDLRRETRAITEQLERVIDPDRQAGASADSRRAEILPFTPPDRVVDDAGRLEEPETEEGSFQEGFKILRRGDRPEDSRDKDDKGSDDTEKTSLSKDVRRVFGDEDDDTH